MRCGPSWGFAYEESGGMTGMREGQHGISKHIGGEAGAVQGALAEPYHQAPQRGPLQADPQDHEA